MVVGDIYRVVVGLLEVDDEMSSKPHHSGIQVFNRLRTPYKTLKTVPSFGWLKGVPHTHEALELFLYNHAGVLSFGILTKPLQRKKAMVQ